MLQEGASGPGRSRKIIETILWFIALRHDSMGRILVCHFFGSKWPSTMAVERLIMSRVFGFALGGVRALLHKIIAINVEIDPGCACCL